MVQIRIPYETGIVSDCFSSQNGKLFLFGTKNKLTTPFYNTYKVTNDIILINYFSLSCSEEPQLQVSSFRERNLDCDMPVYSDSVVAELGLERDV